MTTGHVPIVLVGNKGAVQGFQALPESVQEALIESCAFRVEGGGYAVQDSTTGWDGEVRLLTKTGTFPIGLSHRIRHGLERLGYSVPVASYREEPARLGIVPEPRFTPRDYQLEAIQRFFSLNAPKIGIVQSPPRSGKTITAAEAVRQVDQERVLFLCERLDIAQPPRGAVQKFRDYLGEDYGIGWAYDGEFQAGRVVIATIQTASLALGVKEKQNRRQQRERPMNDAQRRTLAEYIRSCTMVIVDECHHAAADSYRAVLAECSNSYWTLGLSGTPFRDDGADLHMEGAVGPVIHKIEEELLIAQGLLVPCNVILAKMPLIRYPQTTSYADRKRKYVLENSFRNQAIVEFCSHMSSLGKSTIVVADYAEHVELLDNFLTTYEVPHECMMASGKFGVKPSDRPGVWNRLLEKKTLVLVTTLANEGIDIPSLDSVVIAGGGESAVRTLQRVRCSTAYPGKISCTILDFADKAEHFSKQFEQRLQTYSSKGPGVFNIHWVARFQDLGRKGLDPKITAVLAQREETAADV
jgi:superfamily II DNA or RNA helicase